MKDQKIYHHNQPTFEVARAQNSNRNDDREINVADGGDGVKRVAAESTIGVEMLNVAQSEALGTVEYDLPFISGEHLTGIMTEVPVEYALGPLKVTLGIKHQLRVNHQRILIGIPDEDAQMETRNQFQSSELSPTSVTQSISSISRPTLQEQKLSPIENRVLACRPKIERQNSLSIVPVLKKPCPDGFNWRKYGQKQVKSPQGSRSYYKCTHSDCYAKKIECSDHTNRVVEIVYKNQHNHDPPCKVSCSPSDNSEIKVNDEDFYEPETRKRKDKSFLDCSGTLSKPVKKPKCVVHVADDDAVSADGYRWRKYGQKMVKGNPHPRNYYRCTSAGCSVKKHIERAVDDTNNVLIAYTGIHDHDMPAPKKPQELTNAPLAAPTPALTSDSEVNKSEQSPDQLSITKWSVDKEGVLTGETM